MQLIGCFKFNTDENFNKKGLEFMLLRKHVYQEISRVQYLLRWKQFSLLGTVNATESICWVQFGISIYEFTLFPYVFSALKFDDFKTVYELNFSNPLFDWCQSPNFSFARLKSSKDHNEWVANW
jgi:hypothetical protein